MSKRAPTIHPFFSFFCFSLCLLLRGIDLSMWLFLFQKLQVVQHRLISSTLWSKPQLAWQHGVPPIHQTRNFCCEIMHRCRNYVFVIVANKFALAKALEITSWKSCCLMAKQIDFMPTCTPPKAGEFQKALYGNPSPMMKRPAKCWMPRICKDHKSKSKIISSFVFVPSGTAPSIQSVTCDMILTTTCPWNKVSISALPFQTATKQFTCKP